MKIAVIPLSKEYLQNKLFDIKDKTLNRDNSLQPYYDLKNELNKKNIEINTIDIYNDITNVDYIFLFSLDYKNIIKCLFKGLENKMVYFAWEPEVVIKDHSYEQMKVLKKYFKYIFTWNDDLVNNISFFKIYNPYNFEEVSLNTKKFGNKKLLVNISGNKKSDGSKELYSKRLEVIKYFENIQSDEFDFFGIGWDKCNYKNYQGKVDNKLETYQNYKFALSLENMKETNGYITEKILDCFKAEIVPIYLGPNNIDQYIPSNTYINFDKFDTIEELITYIREIDEITYSNYIENIKKYKNSEMCKIFDSDNFVKSILDVIDKDHKSPQFKVKYLDKLFFVIKFIINKIRRYIK